MKYSDHQTFQKQSGAVLFNVLLFSISLTLVFTLVANLLPQVEGEAPVEQEIDLGALTMDSFVSLGESIFNGKGTCTLCHNSMGRAPDILQLNMVATSTERLADSRYKGTASTEEDYMRESMVNPGIYVVSGFGKKGSNDTESPMPVVDKAPISLSTIEMNAVIAFMQAKDGNEISIALPEELPEESAIVDTGLGQKSAPVKVAETADEVLEKFTCKACHSISGTESPVGPDLNNVGVRLNEAQIRQSILDPNIEIAEGFDGGMMPDDFSQKMTVSELSMLIEFLVSQKVGE